MLLQKVILFDLPPCLTHIYSIEPAAENISRGAGGRGAGGGGRGGGRNQLVHFFPRGEDLDGGRN